MLWPNMLAVMHPAGCAKKRAKKSVLSTERSFPVSPQTSPRLTAPRAPSAASRCTHVQLREKKDSGTRLEAPYTAYAATVPGPFPLLR